MAHPKNVQRILWMVNREDDPAANTRHSFDVVLKLGASVVDVEQL